MIRVIPPVWLLATKLEAFAAAAATTASAAETLRMSSCLSMPAKNSVRVRRRTGRSTDLRRWERTRIEALPSFSYGLEDALAGSGAVDRARAVTLPRWRAFARRTAEHPRGEKGAPD